MGTMLEITTRIRMRLRYAFNWKIYFWTWDIEFGYGSTYYDGWNNWVNFGLFSIHWITPPLKSDKDGWV